MELEALLSHINTDPLSLIRAVFPYSETTVSLVLSLFPFNLSVGLDWLQNAEHVYFLLNYGFL